MSEFKFPRYRAKNRYSAWQIIHDEARGSTDVRFNFFFLGIFDIFFMLHILKSIGT